jgi:hypothetical protein
MSSQEYESNWRMEHGVSRLTGGCLTRVWSMNLQKSMRYNWSMSPIGVRSIEADSWVRIGVGVI